MSNEQSIALLKEAIGEHLALLLQLVNSKVSTQSGKGLSTNDFTNALLTKLNGIQAGAQVNVATNLGRSSTATAVTITSSTGNSTSIAAATASAAGVMTGADRTKLDGIAAGAQVNVPTNLGNSPSTTAVSITSSTGSNTSIPAATTTAAGVMSSADKVKLNGIAAGAQVNVPTNIGRTLAASTVAITSSTGTSATIPAATDTTAGVLTSADKVKLDGIQAGAQANVATNLGRSMTATAVTITSSTGNNASLPAATSTAAGIMTAADRVKLDGIEEGAQANVATNLGRSTTATAVTITSSTGNNVSIAAATSTAAGVMTAADRTKLDGIAAGAQANVATNLGHTTTATTVAITSSTGNNTTLPAATTTTAGVMTGADKAKLDGLSAAAPTNLGRTIAASTVTITSSTGSSAAIPAATTSAAGVMSSADKTKLNGIQAGATATTYYTGTSAANVDFPIGTSLLSAVYPGTSPTRAQSVSIYLNGNSASEGSQHYINYAQAGNRLTGNWRVRGVWYPGGAGSSQVMLVERVS